MENDNKNLELIADEIGDLGKVKISFNDKTGLYNVKEAKGIFSKLSEYRKPIAIGLALLSGGSILGQSVPNNIEYENEDGTPVIQQDTSQIESIPIPEDYYELESGILMPEKQDTIIIPNGNTLLGTIKNNLEGKLIFNPIASLSVNDKYLLDRGKVYDPNPTIMGVLGGSLSMDKLSVSGLYFVAASFNSDLPNGETTFLDARENSLLFNATYNNGDNSFSLGYNILDLDVTDKLFKEFTADMKLGNVKLGAFYDINYDGGGGYIGFLFDKEIFNKKIQNEALLRFDKGYLTEKNGAGILNKITIPGEYFNIEGKVFIPIYGFENKVEASVGVKVNF